MMENPQCLTTIDAGEDVRYAAYYVVIYNYNNHEQGKHVCPAI